MKKTLLILGLWVCAAIQLLAQNDVTGKIVNEKGEPLALANVVLLNRQDSAFVKGVVTGEDGCFDIGSFCKGGIIKVTSVGYKTAFKNCDGNNAGISVPLKSGPVKY